MTKGWKGWELNAKGDEEKVNDEGMRADKTVVANENLWGLAKLTKGYGGADLQVSFQAFYASHCRRSMV